MTTEGDVSETSISHEEQTVGRPALREWPTAMSLPRSRPDLSTVALDDNIAIYDELGQVLVLLNVSAFAVLEACDGMTPFKRIVADLAAQHGAEYDVVREDVWRTLRKLASMGLVADAR
jgi:hypothetical protein